MTATGDVDTVRAAARAHRGPALARLCDFMRFRTVSSTAAGRGELRRCAGWLAGYLRSLGFADVRTPAIGEIPLVVGRMTGPPTRHVLVYGHYDVVAPGRRDEWSHPPFAGLVRRGRLHGRGASDDKGPVWAHLGALAAYRRSGRRLPVQVTVVLDGEEEIGSPHLGRAVAAGLVPRADVALVSDTRMLGPDRPVLVSALRGSVSVVVTLQAPGRELHSGSFGGAAVNPAEVLARIVASLHDEDGRVAVGGFYSAVVPPDPRLRERLRRDAPADPELSALAGGAVLTADQRWTAFERTTVRPAVVTTTIATGAPDETPRNAIPRAAWARINLRLVPRQDPVEEARRLARHIGRRVPPGITARVALQTATPPTEVDVDHPAARQVARALEETYGRAPVHLPSGGTIPAVGVLRERLAMPVVLMGFTQPGDGVHGADESFSVDGLWHATDACIRAYAHLGSPLANQNGSRNSETTTRRRPS